MSELVSKLRRMASQSQGFATDAPLEAVYRAKLLVQAAHDALQSVRPEERDEVLSILALARRRVEKYEARLDAWQREVEARAALYNQHERQRIEQPIPPKV